MRLANHCLKFDCKLLFEMIEISSLAVHVTRERFWRCLSESLSSDGRTETHPAKNINCKVRTNENEEKLSKDIGFQLIFKIRIFLKPFFY